MTLEAEITGRKGDFDCPVKLHLYGPSDPTERIRIETDLKKDKILKAGQLKKTRQEAEGRRKLLGLKNGGTSCGLPEGNVVEDNTPEVSLEDLLQASEAIDGRQRGHDLQPLRIDEGVLAQMPKADQPRQVKSKLLPYQLQVCPPAFPIFGLG